MSKRFNIMWSVLLVCTFFVLFTVALSQKPTPPIPSVPKLCTLERRYMDYESGAAAQLIFAQGCDNVTRVHVINGEYEFAGTKVVIGE